MAERNFELWILNYELWIMNHELWILNFEHSYFFFQIMWLVGKNLVVPNLEAIKIDTPPALHRLLESCISYNRNQRPLFTQVLAIVESIMKSLPKISRSISEPILHRSYFQVSPLSNYIIQPLYICTWFLKFSSLKFQVW